MSAGKSGLPAKMSALTWAAVIAAVLYFIIRRYRELMQLPQLDSVLGPVDPDPWLRLVQVRQLLTDGGFFEHIVRNTNAPAGGVVTPWTRPLDMLLVFFTRFTPGEMAPDARLMQAAAWLPPVLGLAALFLLVRAGRGVFNHTHVLWCIVMLAAVNPWVLYFAPGNVDHHGLLALLWCGVLCALAKPLQPGTAALAGGLLGLMLWVSPEALLPIAAVYTFAGVDALRAPRQSLPLALMALAGAAAVWLGLFVEMPPGLFLTQITYDSLSLPHAVLMSLIAAGAGLLYFVAVRGAEMKLRAQSAAASAAVALVALACWFPKFFRGPMVDADPFIRTDFLPFVTEAQPFHMQSASAILVYGWPPLLALLLWLAAGRKRLLPGLLLVFTTGMMLASARWAYYAQPTALLVIATTLPGWCALARPKALRGLRLVPRFFRPYLFLWAVLFTVCAAAALVPHTPKVGGCNAQTRYALQSGQLQGLIGKKPLTVYADSNVSGQALFFTPHRIIAGNYHREGAGLRAMKEIATETKPAAARKKLAERKVDALLVCASDYKEESWLHGLSAENHPAWLKPVSGLRFTQEAGAKPELFLLTP